MNNSWHDKLSRGFFDTEFHADLNWHLGLIIDAVLLLAVLAAAFLAYYITRKVVLGITTKVVKKTENDWDDELLNSHISNGSLCSYPPLSS